MSFPQQPPSSWGQPGANQPTWGSHAQSQWASGGWQQPSQPAPYGFPQPTPYGTGRPAGPAGPAPASSRRSPLAAVLLVLLGLVGAAIVTLVVVGLVNSGNGNVRYVNQDYTPPPANLNPDPLPKPANLADAVTLTQQNPLYRQKMPAPVRCDLKPLDYATATDKQIEDHMNVLAGCLVGAWVVPVEAAGYTMPRPSVTVYQGSSGLKTPCGELPDRNAVYCGANQQIYYANDLNTALPALQSSRFGPEMVMAHEFGHAVQGRTGISTSRAALMQAAATDAEAYELNRRLEAQADCFSGLFIRSASRALGIEQKDVTDFEAILQAIGGSKPGKTHPMGTSRVYWGTMGMSTDDIGRCNTYTADPATVR